MDGNAASRQYHQSVDDTRVERRWVALARRIRVDLSHDRGATWTETQPAGNTNKEWIDAAMSADGSIILAAATNNRIYISTNSGVSWTETQPAGNANKSWFTVASNDDGSVLVAGM